MLDKDTYTQSYIDDCRTHLRRKVDAFEAVRRVGASSPGCTFSADLAELEPRFINALITTLESVFMHRTRAHEGTDQNALHEVRVLATSIRDNHAVLRTGRDSSYAPEASVLGLKQGDAIALNFHEFETLTDAFFADLESRFLSRYRTSVPA